MAPRLIKSVYSVTIFIIIIFDLFIKNSTSHVYLSSGCGDVILISLLVLIDALEIRMSRSLSAAGIRGRTYY